MFESIIEKFDSKFDELMKRLDAIDEKLDEILTKKE